MSNRGMLLYSKDKPNLQKEISLLFRSPFCSDSKLYFSFFVQSADVRNKFVVSVKRCSSDSDQAVESATPTQLEIPVFYNESVHNKYCRMLFDSDHLFCLQKDEEYELTLKTVEEGLGADLYEIHLSEYSEDRRISLARNFIPPLSSSTDYSTLPMNRFLIVHNISASYGGFWWCVMQAVHAMWLAEQYNLIPIIDYEGGLYYTNKIYDPEWVKEQKSWFYTFFEDPFSVPEEIKKKVLANTNRFVFTPLRRDRKQKRPIRYILPEISEQTTFIHTNDSYVRFNKLHPIEYRTVNQKFLKPLAYVKEYMDSFWKEKNIPEGTTLVGVHYRGTDKYDWGGCNEGDPIHYKYEKVAEVMRKRMSDDKISDYYVCVASDEAPFIEFMKTAFPGKVIYHEDPYSVRCNVSTSGNNTDFRCFIKPAEQLTEHEKKVIEEFSFLKDNSIHFGKKDVSNFVKGFYTLVDVLLFENCNYIFRSRGNFSDYCCHMNKTGAWIADMNGDVGK
jgi:hypothetical protein